MKAIVCRKFGAPTDLEIREIERPIPVKSEVLIKIRATAVNDYDWSMIRGRPVEYRFLYGFFSPKHPVPGMEMSGVIVKTGSEVENFRIGDEVYGDISAYGFGTFAEYLVIDEAAVRLKPKQITFEEAAALPHASLLAYQGLYKSGTLRDNMNVLINGAGGGVGTIGLQLCKMFDIHVTGVDTGDKLEMMKNIGFDKVIDYKSVDFTKCKDRYDLILDAKSTHFVSAYLKVLSPEGRYVTVGGTTLSMLSIALFGSLAKKKASLLSLQPNKYLEKIEDLFLKGKIKCVIDGPYPFTDIPWAIQRFGEGKHSGKLVISMGESQNSD